MTIHYNNPQIETYLNERIERLRHTPEYAAFSSPQARTAYIAVRLLRYWDMLTGLQSHNARVRRANQQRQQADLVRVRRLMSAIKRRGQRLGLEWGPQLRPITCPKSTTILTMANLVGTWTGKWWICPGNVIQTLQSIGRMNWRNLYAPEINSYDDMRTVSFPGQRRLPLIENARIGWPSSFVELGTAWRDVSTPAEGVYHVDLFLALLGIPDVRFWTVEIAVHPPGTDTCINEIVNALFFIHAERLLD